MPEQEKSFTTRESIKYFFYMVAVKIFCCLPQFVIKAFTALFASVTWYAFPKRRSMTVASIKKHLLCSEEEAVNIAKKSFFENISSFLEILQVQKYKNDSRFVTFTPSDLYTQFDKETSPVVIASGHIGSWEVMAAMVEEFHPHRQKMVVVRTQRDRAMAKLLENLRGSCGIKPIGHRQATKKVVQALRNNGTVAFLVDHNCIKKEAVFIPFLNEIAAVNSGPAMLALRAKAAVYPMFNIREKNGNYTFHMYKPLYTAELTGTIAERVEQIATYYTDCVADIVKKYPEQWLWMHNRWKTRP